jgi:hypothetical protein
MHIANAFLNEAGDNEVPRAQSYPQGAASCR